MRKLNSSELDKISTEAAQAAQDYISSKISKKEITDLDINIELIHNEGLDVDVSIELVLDDLSTADDEKIVEEAVKQAIMIIDKLVEE
ncbi:MAG TPA: DUF3194 domain-containing protein [Methanobacteriaceae archaeon]|nr:DUF3194 domain-containing protein [Methanobacteriaceae archaeon]